MFPVSALEMRPMVVIIINEHNVLFGKCELTLVILVCCERSCLLLQPQRGDAVTVSINIITDVPEINCYRIISPPTLTPVVFCLISRAMEQL